jgi:hypothetical protein
MYLSHPPSTPHHTLLLSSFISSSSLSSQTVVEHGWVSLKSQRDRDSSPESDTLYDELVALNTAAKANHLGIYTNDEAAKKLAIRQIDWSMDANKYFESLLVGRKALTSATPVILNAIIEHVRDGASFRCFVPQHSCYVSFAFAGATCPRVNTPSAGGAAAEGAAAAGPEPFAVQSKLFTECRLLNRRLDLVSW